MRGSSSSSSSSPIPTIEPRHRLSSTAEEISGSSNSRRKFLRERGFKDVEKALSGSFQYRNLKCKITTLKLVLVVIALATLVTFFHSPPVYIADHPSSSASRPGYLWIREDAADPRYVSIADVDWGQISDIIDKLNDSNGYQGIGLLNFNDSEIDNWKQLLPDIDHVVLHLDHLAKDITWESLYPEWIDEEEDFEVPTCPSLPKLKVPGKPRIDVIAVKLPCNKFKSWSRDVAGLHLQLAAASLAASGKSYHPVRVLLVTECFPAPNLFTCKDLILREGNLWLYEPNLNRLREKIQLPVGSCELAVPLKSKENFYSERANREAYATILHSAHVYVCGAITAAQSIRMAGSIRDLVILVDETISEYHRGGLEAAGWKIHTIQRIRNPKAERDAYNEWNYSKFRLWQLTDYDKIIFIDADLLILRNIDFLFEMPEITAIGNNATLFNSGVMVIEPSNCTFQLLMDHINEIESYNGGDQGYLNEIFTWWHRIPKHMNFLKHFWEGDEEEKKQMKTRLFGADPPILYVIHYLGYKPWLCFRDYDCNWNVDILQEFASDVAHKTWWKVHDAMPENLQKYCLLRSKQKAALEWDRRQAEKANYTDGHWKIKIQDKRLETCFEDFCFWESMLWHWGETNWTDNATVTPSPPPPPAIFTKSLSTL
ncbi:putative UDP-glucuronate:xylan alpha-glucuronosyltransferase 3 [Ricinus communis]|uniref:putative UDP-glucuronate:xylan alpha-glucuronosyltransferase 3 n=1 Tax=Ricinus communis TaxID=3988 RepID=UPI00201ADF5B|nr:putative UDP-glucuronate:xylan alpha-glucuronosyltransferase 3 [Ricinus communis]